MHKSYKYPSGFVPEQLIKGTKLRVDAMNFKTRQIIELKPNNARSIRLGKKQLKNYLYELNKRYPTGKRWTGKIVTYPPDRK